MNQIQWLFRSLLASVILVLVAGCVSPAKPDILPTLTPLPTREVPEGELRVLSPEESWRFDIENYAKNFGVTLEEADRRLKSQEAIGKLNAALRENEADTFSGLWIEHEPAYKVVVLFTRNGEKTIKPYIAGTSLENLVEVRSARYTLAELKNIYAQVNIALKKLDFEVMTSLDESGNRVEITVGDKAWFESELARLGIKLPEGVELTVVEGGSTAKDKELVLTPPVPGIAFPRVKPSEGVSMCYLLEMMGTLKLEDGCLVVQPLGGGPMSETGKRVVVWPPNFTMRLEGEQVAVINARGEEVVRTGEEVYLGGGGSDDEWILPQIPGKCGKEYFIANCGTRHNLHPETELFTLEMIHDAVIFLHYKPTFSQQVTEPVAITGKLNAASDYRCLHAINSFNQTTTLFFPLDWSVRVEGDMLIILNAAGETVARAGEELNLKGRAVPYTGDDPTYRELIDTLPGECIGPAWLVDP